MRRFVAVVGLVGLVGCKTDDAPAPAPAPTPAPTPVREERAPAARPAVTGMPTLPPAIARPLRSTTTSPANPDLALASWCLPGSAPSAVAPALGDALREAGWAHVTARGDDPRIGISAVAGDLRLAITLGGRDQACADGVVATATLASTRASLP